MRTEHRTPLDLVCRAMPVTSVDGETRTAVVVFSTGAAVRRRDWSTGTEYLEELEISSAAIDMTRLQAGAPLLNAHGQYSLADVLGVVESASVENGRAVATVRFSARADVEPIFRDVRDGIVRNVSVGYSVQQVRIVKAAEGGIERRIAIRWTPTEISLVPVGADFAAGVRSGAPSLERTEMQQQTQQVQAPAQTASDAGDVLTRERERAATITQLADLPSVRQHGLQREVLQHIERGTSIDGVRALVLNKLAAVSEATSIRSAAALPEYTGSGFGGPSTDDPTFRSQLMCEALAARIGGPAPSEAARQFMRVKVSQMLRDLSEHRGVSTRTISDVELIQRSLHVTGDLPALLQGTGNRVLRAAYTSAPSLRDVLFARRTAPDFRALNTLAVSPLPIPQRVNQGGEIKFGTISEASETYGVVEYHSGLNLSFQALVNDDLDSVGRAMQQFGRASGERENIAAVGLLTSGNLDAPAAGNGPTMGDGQALFSAAHGNIISGTGSVLSAANGITALSNARQAMRQQRDLDGRTPVNAQPAILLVPSALETVAQQLVTAITPNTTGAVNPFAGLAVFTDPRLDAISQVQWYLFAAPSAMETLQYASLDGYEGPQLMVEPLLNQNGIAARLSLYFGMGAVDWRGVVRSAGA